ncbi:alpha 1,3-glucan synthase [Emydomyces testavorans]|uniref:alpha-1,3-glucan synthase n=1 Tax=Emydomyces testavorans TaxID=2070801 RepID=A0AAF0DJV2_9EURO|nr:alpha 1,3-glucan synthase [Emydomyces testavorans]
MQWNILIVLIVLLVVPATCWPYDPREVGYNLNENEAATSPVEYSGEWRDHEYFPSPENWRFPFYSFFVDRFVNGDPTNDNVNGTNFERDINSNQMRHGGDALGLIDSLDYIQGMGVKVDDSLLGIYIAGTILINEPWGSDGYSPVDTTLLDRHFGDIQTWRHAITEIHKRGMYILMDNTLATLGDLLAFDGYMNSTAPFETSEHKVVWKSDRRYVDFRLGDHYNETCSYPRFWDEMGYQLPNPPKQLKGCYDSEFDQYGDIEAFGVYPDWQRQLAKFASVQDRLREWIPSVREKLIRHSCLMIAQLDIDGFRYDKATQATVDALGDISEALRKCARKVGKKNFFLPGEITSGNTYGSLYVGRGRQPDMRPPGMEAAVRLSNDNSTYFIRDPGKSALDAGAFHYSIYRSLTRFLGLDGNLAAGYDTPVNWVDAWNEMLITNDFINVNTGKVDPRHMFGATNQDVFRWPALKEGTERALLALYIITLHLPGIPLLLWGEEQAFYILDNTAQNYIFGRQAMSSALAWQTHGCYDLGSSQYYQWPLGPAAHGCHDDTVSYDHRDPSHPVRNILKNMYQMREKYPTLNDGYYVKQLSNSTRKVFLPGSNDVPTETGMWSVVRGRYNSVQDFGDGNLPVWLVYQNDNRTLDYHFDCNDEQKALISAFDAGTTVKNLFYPYDEHTLKKGPVKLGIEQSSNFNGCLDTLQMRPWDFRAYVPKSRFIRPKPMITKFSPGHDARLESQVGPHENETLPVELYFSENMDCSSVTNSLSLNSTTENGKKPSIDLSSVQCKSIEPTKTKYSGEIAGIWRWSANLTGVYNGIHKLRIENPRAGNGNRSTDAVDNFLFRIGQLDNPMVFSRSANYSRTLLHRNEKGELYVSHHATGADSYRYSTNWGSTWSEWMPYKGGNDTLKKQEWSGTKAQAWKGEHVIIEYWNRMAGSSSHAQQGDLDWESEHPRRFPHLFWNGPYNQYGYDAGLENQLQLNKKGQWTIRFMTEWPALAQVNVWGMNPDGKPDRNFVFGDSDGNSVLDRLPPSSLKKSVVNITEHPPRPYLSWEFLLDDGTFRFQLLPAGSMYQQMILYYLLLILPITMGITAVVLFRCIFCHITVNRTGKSSSSSSASLWSESWKSRGKPKPIFLDDSETSPALPEFDYSKSRQRRKVLIATMEYEIDDWGITIKIGGLGVMAQIMAKSLGHLDLIWVIPCVSGIDYPTDLRAYPMTIKLLDQKCKVDVQYHQLRNITFVILDAPVFRQQKKDNPYPARMDNLDSAIYYSAWNQCIAQTIERFDIDIYHINDYHGALAPLYILPRTIPVCLSLHNAEFQGLWPIRGANDMKELSEVFNLPGEVMRRYVQFGNVFNLLHAAASYLRIHQRGFGIVAVSEKYAERSYKRYPIFWGLKGVGKLPNPDPHDNDEVDEWPQKLDNVQVDPEHEASRVQMKLESQEWAGLDEDPDAQLFVFVGRWSTQKGVDLIADVFTDLLEARRDIQLICVGPIIDLHGRFAALKLHKLMAMFPNQVYSRPTFTSLPSFVRSGADFALIPSRDEPFGLVAVEFGRRGVLGVGAKVGGLGQMPGWWYPVESTAPRHLLHQLRHAIDMALATKPKVRAKMRARSMKQRFPFVKWVEALDRLHNCTIQIHDENRSSHFKPEDYIDSEEDKDLQFLYEDDEEFVKHLFDPPAADSLPIPSPDLIACPEPVHLPPSGLDRLKNVSAVSFDSLVGQKNDYHLQKVNPLFTDKSQTFTEEFKMRLRWLNGRTSVTSICIDAFLDERQKVWFKEIRDAQVSGKFLASPSSNENKAHGASSLTITSPFRDDVESARVGSEKSESSCGGSGSPLSGLQRFMLLRLGDWPVYSVFLSFGQIIAANSYQITLLTGEIGQSATKLYTVASVYLFGSIVWWCMFRRFKAAVSLTVPFFFYGLAFICVGFGELASYETATGLAQRFGIGFYTFAAASGAVFFALNFSYEGSAPVKDWVFRACTIQGTQQVFVVALWYWGSGLAKRKAEGDNYNGIPGSWKIK